MVRVRDDLERREQVGDSDEQDREDDRRPRQGRPGVLPLRRLERRHAVADRLHAGERHRALAERAEDQEEAERLAALLDALPRGGGHERRDLPERDLVETVGDDPEHDDDVRVRRDHEDRARLADTTKVPEHEQRDQDNADPDAGVVDLRQERGHRRHAGRHRDRDGHDVADEQRGCRQDAHRGPQVVAGHDVAAGAGGVGLDRLPIRDGDDREHHDDQARQRQREEQRARAGEDQHVHDLLGPVGR